MISVGGKEKNGARAAGGAAAGRRCHADRTSRTSHNAKCTMQDKQNISKCRTSIISQSTMQEKQNFTVYCTQVIVQCTMQESKTSRIPTMQLTSTRPTMPPEPTHKQIGLLRWQAGFPNTQCKGIASCYPAPKC